MASSRLGGCALAWCALAFVSCSDEPCLEDKDKVEDCGLQYRRDVCASSYDACITDCQARASCSLLIALSREEAEPPEWLSRCTAKCPQPFQCDDGATTVDARWRCDGKADCIDRADEAGCQHHVCADGQLVAQDSRCDEYEDCEDGSDEAGC
jgi:hypothetical protein